MLAIWSDSGWRVAALLLLLCLLPACATLTVSQERQLGSQVARDMQRELYLIRDQAVVAYVNRIGEDILRAAGPQPFDYRFFVVDDDEINAFAAPGGYIYIHSETILRARNVSELAGVIAHEVGHVAKRHIAENYGRVRGTNVAYNLFVIAGSLFGYGGLAQLGGGLAAIAYLNRFGREAEIEADSFAAEVLPKAGYDPNGLVTFFETLERLEGPRVPTFASNHPATEDRIAATRALVATPPLVPAGRVDDRGRLQIIQRRIELLTGRARPDSRL